jgi:hypothetical protein
MGDPVPGPRLQPHSVVGADRRRPANLVPAGSARGILLLSLLDPVLIAFEDREATAFLFRSLVLVHLFLALPLEQWESRSVRNKDKMEA